MDSTFSHDVILTLTLSLAAGSLLMTLARRMRMPAIVLLLFGGILLGPEFVGLVQPLTLGDTLGVLVSIAVGLILFEGGLTLDLGGYRSASRVIRRLLSVGVVITWLATAAAVWLVFRTSVTIAFLAGSLVIVTGPTVIQPILKRIRLKWNLHSILHWEGVLIDPIGVFVAIMCFEFALGVEGGLAVFNLLQRFALGLSIGFVGGEVVHFLLKKHWVPEDMVNVFIVGSAVLIFGAAEAFLSEAGLLSVTVAGFIVGARHPPNLKRIREFKGELTEILIGTVFILLCARLELSQFIDFGVRGAILVAIVMLVVRPLVIFACTWGESMSVRERIFLSWVAPRGVVAASMSSLFAYALAERTGVDDPFFLETFTYSVIASTVILQGFSAGPLAWFLGLQQKQPKGWLVVGAHPLARRFAGFLSVHLGENVVLVDTNRKAVTEAAAEGCTAFYADARDAETIVDRREFRGIGHVLAYTPNEDLNELICQRWVEFVGKDRLYRWSTGKPESRKGEQPPGRAVWVRLPNPNLLNTEIIQGRSELVELSGSAPSADPLVTPLAFVARGRVLFDSEDAESVRGALKDGHGLYLRREIDYLMEAIDRRLIFTLDAETKEAVIAQMVERMGQIHPAIDRDQIVHELLEREKAFPASLGHGVALPHVRLPHLGQMICCIARLKRPIAFSSEDEEPVRLAFLLLSPIGEAERHLAILGEIARMVAQPDARERLYRTDSPEDVERVIREYRPLRANFSRNEEWNALLRSE